MTVPTRDGMRDKAHFIRDLRAGDRLQAEPFVLADLSVKMARNGRPYLAFSVQDRSGRLAGRWLQIDADLVDDLDAGAGVLVTGSVVARDGTLELDAQALAAHEIEAWDDYLPASPRPLPEMEAELRGVLDSLQKPLRDLLGEVLLGEPFFPRFLRAPAARSLHHACIGGLIEHTLAVVRLCEGFARQYPQVDRDVLVAAALLHDAGKVYEYATDQSFGHTFEGRMLGHIVIDVVLITEALRRCGEVPEELRVRLLHAIVAHHGRLEYGSPVVPATLEASLLNLADTADSRARGFLDHVEQGRGHGAFTDFSRMFGTELLRPGRPQETDGK